MRIVFCGTPDYAVPSLSKLAGAHDIAGVVSQPDQPKGRSKTPAPPPVVAAARALGIPNERIFQPRSINKPEIIGALRGLNPDILCVIAYGNILKKEALEIGRYFPINAHASLLPKYRGAAPIQAALLNGDSQTGVCVMKMEAGLDSGPVLLRRAIPIEPLETAGTLHDKLAALSAECFLDALAQIEHGEFSLDAQDESLASYAPKLEKRSGTIDWTQSAEQIERHIRAMTPWPGAWTSAASAEGKFSQRLRIADAELAPPRDTLPAGTGKVEGAGNNLRLMAGCGNAGVLDISRVQPEGKREMSAGEFVRGAGKALGVGFVWK